MKAEKQDATALKLSGVKKHYTDYFSLSDVSLTLPKGESLVILGPSGSGKTTLLRLVAGFLTPDSGVIELGGKRASLPGRIVIPPSKRKIGMVFQSLALWSHLSVRENLSLVMNGHRRERNENIERLLSIAHLQGFERKRPSELSGGEKQRLALARAIACDPDLLLMDEPLRSLDPYLKGKLMEWMSSIRDEVSASVIYVTHDIREASIFSDSVVVLNEGRVLQKGNLEAIRKSPVDDVARRLISEY